MKLLLISKETDRMIELAGELREEHVVVETEWAGSLRGKWGERFLKQVVSQDEVDALLLSLKEKPELLEILPALRSKCRLPIMVMGSRDEENYYEEILCFEQGADDYIRPAVKMPVLILRLQRLIGLYKGFSEKRGFQKGLEEGETDYYWQGEPLYLTPKEYAVLFSLMHSRKEVVLREELIQSVWHHPEEGNLTPKQEAALNTMIRKLKKKLEATPLQIDSCYGRGYRLQFTI